MARKHKNISVRREFNKVNLESQTQASNLGKIPEYLKRLQLPII